MHISKCNGKEEVSLLGMVSQFIGSKGNPLLLFVFGGTVKST